MHPKTDEIRRAIRQAWRLRTKVERLRGAYAGETAYVLTCGPSINDSWSDAVATFLRDKLVVSVKQTHDLAPTICDFHILNSWNYTRYAYEGEGPIVVAERALGDPRTPGMRPDLRFRIPRPRDFSERLATSGKFGDWTFDRSLDRPWGPGVMYELVFPLLVHAGVREIVTLGWDLGELDSPTMPHFFAEEPPDSGKSDGILNKPRIRDFEVDDIARSTKPLYEWLQSLGIDLYVISDRSLVDSAVPRLDSVDAARPKRNELPADER